jgi:ankyrin repeat protein
MRLDAMLVESLPKEINSIIVNNIPLSPCFKTVEEVNGVMVALACVNKSWNLCINDSGNTLSLIKKLSKRFDLCDMEVTTILSMKEAQNRYAIQTAALCNWDRNNDFFICENLGKLLKNGLDLDFTYDDRRNTLLLKAAFSNVFAHTGHAPRHLFDCRYLQVSKWLIDHGADINVITTDGKTPSILIFSIFNNPLIQLFLNHPKFNIHYQDNAGDTVLHCCFQQRIRYEYLRDDSFRLKLYTIISCVVQKLIEMKANPSLPNKQGETSFDLAKRTGYEQFMKILDPQYNS